MSYLFVCSGIGQFQDAFTPNTTSEALQTQQDLARSDEPHEHQHQDGT